MDIECSMRRERSKREGYVQPFHCLVPFAYNDRVSHISLPQVTKGHYWPKVCVGPVRNHLRQDKWRGIHEGFLQ